MKTWLANYRFPQLLALITFVFLIPGLIFIAWAWGKYKCPNCGALGKNTSDLGAAAPVTSMQHGAPIVRILLVSAAVPFGWVLGVLIARVVAGPDFGQLPVMTVPIAIFASIAVAIWITS